MSISSSRPRSRRNSAPNEECERLIQLHYFHIPLVSALHNLGNQDDDRTRSWDDDRSLRLSPTPSLESDSGISDGVNSAISGRSLDLYTGVTQPPAFAKAAGKRKTPDLDIQPPSTHTMKTRSQVRTTHNDFWELDISGKKRKMNHGLG